MRLGELLSQGGWSMIPIYVCSVLALAIFCQRWWIFRQIRAKKLPWVEPILQSVGAMQYKAAIGLCQRQEHPVARILRAATEIAQTRPDRVQAEAERVGENELQTFEDLLPYLGLIAQMAPLLGLLGTVIGMVQMFLGLQQAGMSQVDASALSSGIWQALLTTAAGLIVAAPTLAGLLYLQVRLDRLRLQMRDAVERLLHVIPSSRPLGATKRTEPFAEAGHTTDDLAHEPAFLPPEHRPSQEL